MAAPQVIRKETDLSTYVKSNLGIYEAIVIKATKGEIGKPRLISSEKQLLKYFTPRNKIDLGMDLGYYSAIAALSKTDKLWVCRAANNALYGGFFYKKDGTVEQVNQKTSAMKEVSFKINSTSTQKKYNVVELEDVNILLNRTVIIEGHGTNKIIEVGEKQVTLENALTKQMLPEKVKAKVKDEEVNLVLSVTASSADVIVDNTESVADLNGKTLQLDNSLGEFIINNVDDVTKTLTLNKVLPANLPLTGLLVTAPEVPLTAEGFSDPSAVAMDEDTLFFIYGANEGKWNNDVRVKIQTNFTSIRKEQKLDRFGAPVFLDEFGKETNKKTDKPVMVDNQYTTVYSREPKFQFIIQVFTADNLVTPVEEFICSRDRDARDGFGQNLYVEDVVNSSNYIRIVDNTTIPLDVEIPTMNMSEYEHEKMPLYNTVYDESKKYGIFAKMVGGFDGYPITDSNMIRAVEPYRSAITYPIKVLLDGGHATVAYHKKLIEICEDRGDCVMIGGLPFSAENSFNYAEKIVDYRLNQLNANSSFGGLYSPWVKITDKYNNRDIFVSPDGYVGGAIAQTEKNYELWYPVAGFKRGMLDVLDTKIRFEKGELDYLYDNGINPIRFYPGKGIMIWGNKTLQSTPSALDRMNVRLMLTEIEPSISDALEQFLFELNDPATRDLAKFLVVQRMEGVKARKGVLDFMVVCDDSNNTPDDVINNTMNLDLFVIPPYGIDYIKFNTVITKAGMSFSLAQSQLRNS